MIAVFFLNAGRFLLRCWLVERAFSGTGVVTEPSRRGPRFPGSEPKVGCLRQSGFMRPCVWRGRDKPVSGNSARRRKSAVNGHRSRAFFGRRPSNSSHPKMETGLVLFVLSSWIKKPRQSIYPWGRMPQLGELRKFDGSGFGRASRVLATARPLRQMEACREALPTM